MGFGHRQIPIEKLHAIRMNAAVLGIPIPIAFGQNRLTGKLIWYGDFTATKEKQQGGKGLGKGGSQYVYAASVIAALCHGPVKALLSVWDSTSKFIVDGYQESTTVPTPPPGGGPPGKRPAYGDSFAVDQVPSLATSYSYAGIDDYGSPGPVTLAGTTQVLMTYVAGVQAVLALDSFTQANGAPSPAWSFVEGTFQINGNAIRVATVGADSRAMMYYNGTSFPNDQWASLTIGTIGSATCELGPAVRMAAGAETCYAFYHYGGTLYIDKIVAGTLTTLASYAHVLANGDVLSIQAQGTTITGSLNGTVVCTAVDSAITSGASGIAGYGASSAPQGINWAAGQIGSALAAGQYFVNPATGTYTFSTADSGKTVQLNYSFYRYKLDTEELSIVPFSPGPYTVTVTQSAVFYADLGVRYYPGGNAFVLIASGTPTAGQYKRSGGMYTFAAADQGQGIVISYEYVDPNKNNNAPSVINLTLIGGGKGQSPWSYLSSRHPSQALGYTQLAAIASSQLYLGYSPELPNYSYELALPYQAGGGVVDANPADCIEAVLTDSGYGIGFPSVNVGDLTAVARCCAAYSYFISPLIENQDSAASVIGSWLEAGMIACYWSEGLLKFVPYCDASAVGNGVLYQPSTTTVADLTDDDFLTGDKGENPVRVTRTPWVDAFNRVVVSYNARVNDYNPEPIYEQDEASIARFGLRQEDPKTWDFITTLASAQYAASMRLQRNVYVRNSYEFKLPQSFARLEPMDVVTLKDATLGLNATPVRVQKVEDDPVEGLTVTAEDFVWGVATPAYNPKDTNNPPPPLPGHEDPRDTQALVIEIPGRLGMQAGNMIYGFCTGSNENWGGCHVWVSYDGTKYQQMRDASGNPIVVNGPSRMGKLASSLASYGGANPDTAHTLGVAMSNDSPLASTTSAGASSSLVTLSAIVSAGPTLELLTYETATLVADQEYNLTTLYRGLMGTTAGAHSTNDLFARVSDASFQYQYDPAYVGQTIWLKFTSFNLLGQNEQNLADVTAYEFAIAGSGPGAIALDTGYLNVSAPGYAAYRPLSNPLTAHDAGSNATINIASFSMALAGHSNISYNSGSITALAYNTLYYVYLDDATLSGGSATYQATTTKENTYGTTRMFVGSVQTPRAGAPDTTGNNDGGNGSQGGMLNIYEMSVVGTPGTSGNGSITNANNMIDGDLTTKATFSVTGNNNLNTVDVQLSGPPALTRRYSQATLKVRWECTVDTLPSSASDGFYAAFYYQGTPTTVIFNLYRGTGTQAATTASLSLPLGLNLSQVQVFISLGVSGIVASGTMTCAIYEAWIEVIE